MIGDAADDLNNLIAATGIGAIFLDANLRIRRIIEPIETMLDLQPSDVGRSLADIAPAHSNADLMTTCRSVLEASLSHEDVISTDDGRHFLRRVLPYRSGAGSIDGVVVSFLDVSAHMNAEAIARQRADLERRIEAGNRDLALSEYRVRAILDASGDAIVTMTSEGLIKSFNRAAERMFGYTASEVLDRRPDMLFSPSVRPGAGETLLQHLGFSDDSEAGSIKEVPACRKDGAEFPAQMTVAPVDHLGMYISVIRDVTEQRTLQQEILRIAASEQRRIGEELHDGTQQELTGLSLLAQNLAEMDAASDPAKARRLARRLAEGIAESARHVQLLAKGLVPVAIDAEGLTAALADLASRTTEETGIACDFEPAEQLPNLDDTTVLHIFRIAQEAVTNAIKHAKTSRITITLESSDGYFSVRIRDRGVGIADVRRSRRGLGLRLMAHRCELIGGSFGIRDADGGGTEVSCQVPIGPGMNVVVNRIR